MNNEWQKDLKEWQKDLFEWLLSIEEDDPLQDEIKYLIFNLSNSSHILSLSYSASDHLEKIVVNGEYYPLEAQYFFSQNFFTFCEQIKQNIEIMIFELKLTLDYFVKAFSIFDKKTIIIGKSFCEPTYQYVVN